jgi:nucleoside-diphosphate-sugar epimerase
LVLENGFMRVFVTGATGFVGSAVVNELLAHGHQVLGLARSDEGAAKLKAAGAEVLRGTIEQLDVLKAGAAQADGVAHLAFNHDFSQFARNAADDRAAIEAMGGVLEGSDRPLLVTSGVALFVQDRPVTEEDVAPPPGAGLPRMSETAAQALAARGVRATSVRLPPTTHGVGDKGFVTYLRNAAIQAGFAGYVGEGANHWPAGHRLDAAKVYRLALEKGAPSGPYHATAEEGVPMKAIAEAIGRNLGLPTRSITPQEATEVFGWFAGFAGADVRASSARTRAVLGWEPTGPTLLEDLADPAYWAD